MLKQGLTTVLGLLLLLFVSCSNEEGVTIRGEIANLESPYILISFISADTLAIDTVVVDNHRGRFTYHAPIDTATVVTLFLNDFQQSIVVFADKGDKLSVRGDAQLSDIIRITGNEINDELTAFKMKNENLLRQRQQLTAALQQFCQLDTNRITSYTMTEELLRLNILNRQLAQQAEEFIEENPTRFSSLILINDFFTDNDRPQTLERVLRVMEGDVLRTQLARRLQDYSERVNRSAVGAPIPFIELIDIENDTINLRDFTGKYTLLSFVATDGIESRDMIRSLQESYKALDRDSVQFITIYIDSDFFPVTYLESDSITWTVVVEDKGWGANVVEMLNVQYVPFNILISPDGRIQDRNIFPQGVTAAIRSRRTEE